MLVLDRIAMGSGPDGVPGRAWVLALVAFDWNPSNRGLESLLGACLEWGQFSLYCKLGKLVLIKKDGGPTDSPSAHTPIVLVGEVGKLFERVIADSVGHLANMGPNQKENQSGFGCGVGGFMNVGALAAGSSQRCFLNLPTLLTLCRGVALGRHSNIIR